MDGAILQQSADGTLHQIINLCWMPFLLRHFHGIKSSAIVYAQGSLQDTKTTGSITTVNLLAQGFEGLAVLTCVTGGPLLHRESYQGFFSFTRKKSNLSVKVTFFSGHKQNF